MREDEYSHKGVDKATQIDKKLIESNEYRRKFDNATDNPKVNKALYDSAKEILFARSGTHYESMCWIDGDTGEIIAKADYMGKSAKYTGIEHELRVEYGDKIVNKIKAHQNVVTIHNHPNSTAPSPADVNISAKLNYKLGFTVSHNGTVYKYFAKEEFSDKLYNMYTTEFLISVSDFNTAQIMAYEKIAENTDIFVLEVKS